MLLGLDLPIWMLLAFVQADFDVPPKYAIGIGAAASLTLGSAAVIAAYWLFCAAIAPNRLRDDRISQLASEIESLKEAKRALPSIPPFARATITAESDGVVWRFVMWDARWNRAVVEPTCAKHHLVELKFRQRRGGLGRLQGYQIIDDDSSRDYYSSSETVGMLYCSADQGHAFTFGIKKTYAQAVEKAEPLVKAKYLQVVSTT